MKNFIEVHTTTREKTTVTKTLVNIRNITHIKKNGDNCDIFYIGCDCLVEQCLKATESFEKVKEQID